MRDVLCSCLSYSFDPRIQVQAKCGDGSKVWNLDETRTCAIDIGSCMLRECLIISKF